MQPIEQGKGVLMQHLSTEELTAGLRHIQQSPRDYGQLHLIVIRPEDLQRKELASCEVSSRLGVHGDTWANGCWKSTEDGSPDPDVQVTLTNCRAIDLISGGRDRWALAGDQFYVDLELSDENLPAGTQLSLGTAILQITDTPHNGCGLFQERYGRDAVLFVNSAEGKRLHLRGIYAKVIQDGLVTVGDTVTKL